jgi:hypothetical protein
MNSPLVAKVNYGEKLKQNCNIFWNILVFKYKILEYRFIPIS